MLASLLPQRNLRCHIQGFARRILLVFHRAYLNADNASGTVFHRYLQSVVSIVAPLLTAHFSHLEAFRLVLQLFAIHHFRTNYGMGTGNHAFVTLDADVRLPNGYFQRNVAFLPLRRTGGEGAIGGKSAYRKFVPFPLNNFCQHFLHIFGSFVRYGRGNFDVTGGFLRHFDFVQILQGMIDCGKVFLHNLFALLSVSFANGIFNCLDGFIPRQHTGNGKEAGLHDGIDARSHSGFLCHIVGVDNVKFQFFLDDFFLHLARQFVPHLIRAVRGIQQESSTRFGSF